ncbi:MAG: hypothetical protein M3275_08605 [Thermoproteota archaeon]|nr:hypothetical protein [Thermoproteota archaeon]
MNPKSDSTDRRATNKTYELDSAAAELGWVIRAMSTGRENDEMEKVTKRYTTADEKEARSYEAGFADGYRADCQDCWGKGFDEGLKQAAAEQKDKEEELD